MNTILLPTDFSDNAFNAIRYALAFYQGEPCRFILFHAYQEPHGSTGMFFSIRKMMERNAQEDMLNFLKRVETLHPEKEHSIETQAVYGPVTESVLHVTQKENVDLIIIGTQGASGLREYLWGSNAADIIRKARNPVMAIPQGARFEKPDRIALATDFGDVSDPKIFSPLVETILHFDAELMVVHVTKPGDEKKILQLEEQSAEMKGKFKLVKETYHIPENDDLQEGIAQFIKEKDIQLIAMLTRNHNFFDRLFHKPSVEKWSFHTQIPLLAIHN